MKELSIEEKAQRYDEAIERANSLLSGNKLGNAWIYKLLPELKENEDKNILNAIAEGVQYCEKYFGMSTFGGMPINTILAWIEKQGEKKTANKVKPKFKVGDWVIDKQGIVHQIARVIENVTNHTFAYDIVGGGYFNDSEEGVRLWTIKDAKDGDLIVCDGFGYDSLLLFKSFSNGRISLHCWYNSQTKNFHLNANLALRDDANIQPATKEQRAIFFAKMQDAGCAWDAEKKELKKIKED